jgi:hypothetical protein
MKGRDKLFFNLLTFLLLVVLGLVGYKTRDVDQQIKRWESEIRRRQERGVQDPVLRETVDKLEAELRARLAESFDLEEDPLNLLRVIHTRKFRSKIGVEDTETETTMRLSCTVIGEMGASAIIKHRGRSNVVMVDDKIGDYRVESIGVNRVVLVRGGERLKLETEKAPDTIAEEEKRFGPAGENKPIVEVKQIPLGNE